MILQRKANLEPDVAVGDMIEILVTGKIISVENCLSLRK